MTLAEVKAAVEKIKSLVHDDEAAHAAEDDLYLAVLRHFAASDLSVSELARAALETQEIKFSRWCA